ncbi:hypothetical protein K461DRAFT_7454 [Myriangium duriaei CBS 260.36]|uniref:Uncharacterized protein n=1 Tax=Myriangium duriaei CBS 260.36 TaxID=1168546 RepID=A0A9P4J7S8_9PEZI|nr:hypothetical protein K461DRAFT_7454 [Myriangium duriaei CBS 260.36]
MVIKICPLHWFSQTSTWERDKAIRGNNYFVLFFQERRDALEKKEVISQFSITRLHIDRGHVLRSMERGTGHRTSALSKRLHLQKLTVLAHWSRHGRRGASASPTNHVGKWVAKMTPQGTTHLSVRPASHNRSQTHGLFYCHQRLEVSARARIKRRYWPHT